MAFNDQPFLLFQVYGKAATVFNFSIFMFKLIDKHRVDPIKCNCPNFLNAGFPDSVANYFGMLIYTALGACSQYSCYWLIVSIIIY